MRKRNLQKGEGYGGGKRVLTTRPQKAMTAKPGGGGPRPSRGKKNTTKQEISKNIPGMPALTAAKSKTKKVKTEFLKRTSHSI